MDVSLDIVIINWNSMDGLANCVRSVINSEKNNYNLSHIHIVDNASHDNSTNTIGDTKSVQLVRNKINLGFGAACNQIALKSNADWLLFLNPDIVLKKKALENVMLFLQKKDNRMIGIAGVQLLNSQNQILRTCRYFPQLKHFVHSTLGLTLIFPGWASNTQMQDWDHKNTCTVDQVMGACFFVRTSVFKTLNGFDQRFFLFYEEVDFCLRAHDKGWTICYISEAQAWHYWHKPQLKARGRRIFYSNRSIILYGLKHFSKQNAIILVLLTLFIEPFSRIVYALYRFSLVDIGAVVLGTILTWSDLKLFKTIFRIG